MKLSDFRKKLPLKINQNMYYDHLYRLIEDINRSDDDKFKRRIDFDIFLPSIGKNLQRPLCWSLQQKQELIISVLKGVKIANFTVIVYSSGKGERHDTFRIVDGKQRLSTLISFVKNEFPIVFEGEEFYYNELPKDCRHEIDWFDLHFDTVYEYYDAMIPDDVKIAWFEQINFAGTQQDIEHLKSLKSC
jgi:hypothetical protein